MSFHCYDMKSVKKLVSDYLHVHGTCDDVPLCHLVFRLRSYIWSPQKGWKLGCQVQKQVDVIKGKLAEPIDILYIDLKLQVDGCVDMGMRTAYELSLLGKEAVMHVWFDPNV